MTKDDASRMTPTNDAPVTVERADIAELTAFLATYAEESDGDLVNRNACDPLLTWGILRRLAALASAPAGDAFADAGKPIAPAGDGVPFTGVEAWDELVNVDDRTSPEEYPDMCLITRDELIDFMQRAAGHAIERHVRDALNDSEELADGSVNITANHARRLNADVDAWEAAALARPRAAVGEREAALEAALKRAAVNMTNTPRHNRGSVQDRHIGAAREEIRLALQSPPAKVEG